MMPVYHCQSMIDHKTVSGSFNLNIN